MMDANDQHRLVWVKAMQLGLAASARVAAAGAFLAFLLRRFRDVRCLRVAASLSYTSLLALVPLLAIVFSVLAAFPVFDAIKEEIRRFIFLNVAPHAGEQARNYVDTFVANTNQLTALGVVGLAATAIMLLSTIENAFNFIWRVVRPRRLSQRLVAYWTVLTLGPLLAGGAISMSAYLYATVRWTGLEAADVGVLARMMPFVLTVAAFAVLYVTLPNCRVRWAHAATGGLVAAALFELLKQGFGEYVQAFPAYRTIYGAMSSLPLFLIWMYLVWSVILFGGVIAAAWPEWRAERARSALPNLTPGIRLALTLKILSNLQVAQREGRSVDRESLTDAVGGESGRLRRVLDPLVRERYAVEAEDGSWLLARDLAQTTLYDLCRSLGMNADIPPIEDLREGGWTHRIHGLLEDMDAHNRAVLGVTLGDLFAPTELSAARAQALLRPVD